MAHVLTLKELKELAMFITAFDTLKLVKRLIGIGVSPHQAEAGAEILAEIFNDNLQELATKEDLQHEIGGLRKDMNVKHEFLCKDMQLMAERFDSKLEKFGRNLTIRHGLITATLIIAATALNKFF